jgi:SAM-dependent methyltransferase
MQAADFSANIRRFSGFAGVYDQYRPAPPAALAEILCSLAGTAWPALVVDLGCGTGLSTRYWAGRAAQVIGIDPSPDMLDRARQATPAATITYQPGFSPATGLPDGCADLITCSQSLHWMEPQATFHEARRILRPGGVFAAFDYDWPPTTPAWEADQAYERCIERAVAVERTRFTAAPPHQWPKEGHLARMQASGSFRYVKEIVLHHVEPGNAARLVGVLLSQGLVDGLLRRGVSEQELGIDDLRAVAAATLGDESRPWYWSSRLRFGIV